ncbi:MAG: M20/M25/M40 family metallo-hydrolase, partial [Gemmatimonadetes bacterium]|nr:M20/M25/M40 family metallo-hydrolase [Gemmatimonadota bacterium]NIR79620.1 M20/M25/M40 family metallo-hydrolase [Gemmatimonadota bacterium]NIT88303.1 M20/M25/M40 family metallo-hydrolase [Gemmatimonadota bacterium]NIU32116.1 M20/M25/M40 family metallo-hydrolase [Gemmatimonadota bacterium]NIV62485.1 M20/M25/M40 family metallo-hydrolase [Gemmatimonadota bacterium]
STGVGTAGAQEESGQAALQEQFRQEMARVRQNPAVREAMRIIEETDDRTIQDQIELTEIPAPPFNEDARAARYVEMLREVGVDSVWIDAEGNVLGLREGTIGEETLIFSGHLDTVFPEGTDVTVTQRGDTLFAPGIGDDGRGITTVLAVLRAMNRAGIRTEDDILFTGTVGEEGLGDLRGMKHLFGPDGPDADAFISVDGTSARRVTNAGLGSHRYRVTFEGPGGHSWGAFGLVNPHHALGAAIEDWVDAADAYTMDGPRTSYNVGRIGGGTSVNSIPFESWMEVDMRSHTVETLNGIDSLFQRAIRRAVDEQNELRREGEPLTVDVEMIGDRPSGLIAPETPLVQRGMAATMELGMEPALGRSSTDSNIPISMGIPAITIGGGGEGRGAHS